MREPGITLRSARLGGLQPAALASLGAAACLHRPAQPSIRHPPPLAAATNPCRLVPALLPTPAPQDNDAVKAGLNRYVKKKKLERLDTYVPPLLEARGQLIRVGRVMREWKGVVVCACMFACLPAPAPSCTTVQGPAAARELPCTSSPRLPLPLPLPHRWCSARPRSGARAPSVGRVWRVAGQRAVRGRGRSAAGEGAR